MKDTSGRLSVGFFASSFFERSASGTGIQAFRVISELCHDYSPALEVWIFCNNRRQYESIKVNSNFPHANVVLLPDVRGSRFRSFRQYMRYSISNRDKIDILHFFTPRFYPFFWLFPAKHFTCTFHGAGDINSPRDKFVLSRNIFNLVARTSYRHLAGIVVMSSFAKVDVHKAYRIPLQRISVIHPGTDDFWKNTDVVKDDLALVGQHIVVVVGRWQKYKNIQVVINSLLTRPYADYAHIDFIFVGKKVSPFSESLSNQLKSLNSRNIHHIEYASNEAYISLLAKAQVVVFPSLNEGFGLPAFEAFGQGTNIIVHEESPAAQILHGQSGFFVGNLRHSDSFWTILREAIHHPKSSPLQRQEFLQSIGATWKQMVEQYVLLYRQVESNG
jgi:glycosyltransferase involved in cell wall biosynthesis